ncbi:uncharacterized protein LOC62_02G002862 [Vanrija pseudolonga]|uniref:Uncharacterized protein n=1 Tax=Vanrija pseudolonga TaxID=143232 RepID=A0AAF0Y2X9_9TREE|nr:hypothetical protein LOC62_02G002862 [Vanrija pseudolonga]
MKTTALVTAIAAASVASAIPSTPHGEVQERDVDPRADNGHVEARDAAPDPETETEPLVDGSEGTTLVERAAPIRNETAPGPPTSGGGTSLLRCYVTHDTDGRRREDEVTRL